MGYVLNLQKLEFNLAEFAPAGISSNSNHDCSSASDGGCGGGGASSLSTLLCQ